MHKTYIKFLEFRWKIFCTWFIKWMFSQINYQSSDGILLTRKCTFVFFSEKRSEPTARLNLQLHFQCLFHQYFVNRSSAQRVKEKGNSKKQIFSTRADPEMERVSNNFFDCTTVTEAASFLQLLIRGHNNSASFKSVWTGVYVCVREFHQFSSNFNYTFSFAWL